MSYRWENILVSSDLSIKSTLEVIDRESLRAALVIDSARRLQGVVTDGDVRRGILNGVPLGNPVSDIMNPHPITAGREVSREDLVLLMNKQDLLFIPLVENEKLVGLETVNFDINVSKNNNVPVFIMAGGFGTRLKPLTDNCPKPMLKIGDKPILETTIRNLMKSGFWDFYISTHYMPEQIKNHFGDGSSLGIKITYIHEDKPLGTGGALGLLPKSLSSSVPIVIINGDVLTNINYKDLLEFHFKNESEATMCVREYDFQVPYGVIRHEGNEITGMVEKPTHRFFVNAGIYVLSSKIAMSVPSNINVDLPTLLEQRISHNEKILMFPIHEYWLDIGRIDDYNRAQIDIFNIGI